MGRSRRGEAPHVVPRERRTPSAPDDPGTPETARSWPSISRLRHAASARRRGAVRVKSGHGGPPPPGDRARPDRAGRRGPRGGRARAPRRPHPRRGPSRRVARLRRRGGHGDPGRGPPGARGSHRHVDPRAQWPEPVGVWKRRGRGAARCIGPRAAGARGVWKDVADRRSAARARAAGWLDSGRGGAWPSNRLHRGIGRRANADASRRVSSADADRWGHLHASM